MQKTVIAAVAVLFSASAAYAADLGGFKDAPMVSAVPNWAGLYVGGSVGFGVGTSKSTYPTLDEDNLFNLSAASSSLPYDVNGAIYGVHLGYNFQRGPLVYGLEAAFNGTGIKGNRSDSFSLSRDYEDAEWVSQYTNEVRSKLNWYSTVTGRIGYSNASALFYGFGGAAWGKVKTTDTTTVASCMYDEDETECQTTSAAASDSATHFGWTAGAGIEYMLTDRLSTRVEYAHVDLGEKKIFDGAQEVDFTFDTIKIGASYKLTSEREPLK